jgi:hypothetical protein
MCVEFWLQNVKELIRQLLYHSLEVCLSQTIAACIEAGELAHWKKALKCSKTKLRYAVLA